METGRRLITRHAGIYLFLPLLAQLRFDRLVTKADYPGSKMVPAANALISMLTLKLLDKERLSHIDDFNCDEALGLFAGLNILPKKSFATDYSYRTTRTQQLELLKGWVKKLSPLLFPDAKSFSLDFHAIGHRGEETDLCRWKPLGAYFLTRYPKDLSTPWMWFTSRVRVSTKTFLERITDRSARADLSRCSIGYRSFGSSRATRASCPASRRSFFESF